MKATGIRKFEERLGSFVLMEVLLALTLFGLVAVALTNALSQVGKLAIEGQFELHVINGLQTALLEGSKVPELEPGVFTSDPDSLGIVYETTIEELELYNVEEQQLADMYRILVKATWIVAGRQEEEIAETFRYLPTIQGAAAMKTGCDIHRKTGKIARAREAAREKGFTLLEVTLALMLIVILMGGIYSIATGAIQLGAEVAEAQNREMLVHSFLQLCRRNIESLPGNGGMTLFAEESGRYYVTEVSFINAPLSFSFAAVPAGFDKTVLKSEADPRGYLRVDLLYLNEEDEESLGTGLSDNEDGITLPLLEGVSVFEWRFYDVETDLWEVVWEDEEKRPSFVELTLGFFDGQDPIRTVFWLPPVANPEQVINAGSAAGGAVGGGGGGGIGGGGPGGGGGGRGDGQGPPGGQGGGRGTGSQGIPGRQGPAPGPR